jgi:hypothetical protein
LDDFSDLKKKKKKKDIPMDLVSRMMVYGFSTSLMTSNIQEGDAAPLDDFSDLKKKKKKKDIPMDLVRLPLALLCNDDSFMTGGRRGSCACRRSRRLF